MSDDVVRCRCNWTHWFNSGVHIPHDFVRHRNDTDVEIELGSISASVSHDVARCRTTSDDIVRCRWVVRCRLTSSRHSALSCDVVRSVNTALVTRREPKEDSVYDVFQNRMIFFKYITTNFVRWQLLNFRNLIFFSLSLGHKSESL